MGNRVHVKTGKFRWSFYWKKWSIVLLKSSNDGSSMIEMDISGADGDMDRVRSLNVQMHTDSPMKGDKAVDELPAEWAHKIADQLGEKVASFIQNHDSAEILAMIDFNKFRMKNNGSASLYDIVKDECAHLLPKR